MNFEVQCNQGEDNPGGTPLIEERKGVSNMLANKIIAVLAMSIGLVFVMAFAVQAYMMPDEGTFAPIHYSGKIVGIDPTYKILTVQAGPKDESYFTVTDNASLTMCGKDVSFNDLKLGDSVSIRYYSESLGGNHLVTNLMSDMKC
jgi:hypothetical protein